MSADGTPGLAPAAGGLTARPPALVDLNVCLGPLPGGDQVPLDVPGLLATMDRLGIGHAVPHHSWARHGDVADGNRHVIDVVAGQSRLAAAVVVTPLDTGELGAPDDFQRLLEDGRVRLAVAFPRAHGWSLRGVEATTLLSLLCEAGVGLLVPADQTDLEQVAAACTAFPDLALVLSTVGYRSLRRLVALLDRFDNLRCDLSYFAAHDAVEVLVERFGPRVLVYGSGMPHCDPAGSVARLRWSALDAGAHEAIARGNAEVIAGPFGVGGNQDGA